MSWMPMNAFSPRTASAQQDAAIRCTAAAKKTARLRGLLAAAIALLFLGLAASASASTVLKLDMQSLVANSEQIVEGEVVEVEAKVEDGKVYTYTTVVVKDALKGAEDGETVTIKQIGGRTANLATRVAGVPAFKSGERVVVFLEKIDADALPVVTGMSQGKFHIALGPDNITPYAVPYLGDLALIEPVKSAEIYQAQDEIVAGQALTQEDAAADDKTQDAESAEATANFRAAQPAELYRQVAPLDEFKQRIRQVVEDQSTPIDKSE
jgi:hypothetical protein